VESFYFRKNQQAGMKIHATSEQSKRVREKSDEATSYKCKFKKKKMLKKFVGCYTI
jgi:hypothetical protein